ncbi:MAG: hypothetical protein R3E46_05490 [Sedimenticolaceae bacterium]
MAQHDRVKPDGKSVTRGVITHIAEPGGPRGTHADTANTRQRFGDEQIPLPCIKLSAPGGAGVSEIRH